MKRYQIVQLVIIALCVIAMGCIWPFCIFRRNMNVDAVAESDWRTTDEIIESGEPLEQFFIARTSRLQYIAFVVETVGTFSEDDVLMFELVNANGEIIANKAIPVTEIESYKYCYVPVNKWLRKGKEYSFRLSVDSCLNGEVRGMYAEIPGNSTTEATGLAIGEMQLTGETQTRYGYGFPMNIKNTICIWAFFLTIGLTISNVLKGVWAKDEKMA